MTVRISKARTIPPLESGDRLSRPEFERRYHTMPGVKKAELIEGEVYMPSPVSFLHHGLQDSHLGCVLAHYSAYTTGTATANNTSVRLDLENEPQPDQLLIVHPAHGGRVEIDGDGYITGSPELVAEISGSSASIDLGKKKNVYRRNGVMEYIVWRVFDESIDWFALRHDNWELISPDSDGIIRSAIFPGLWLNVPPLLAGDLAAVLATLTLGLQLPEHTAFTAALAATSK